MLCVVHNKWILGWDFNLSVLWQSLWQKLKSLRCKYCRAVESLEEFKIVLLVDILQVRF